MKRDILLVTFGAVFGLMALCTVLYVVEKVEESYNVVQTIPKTQVGGLTGQDAGVRNGVLVEEAVLIEEEGGPDGEENQPQVEVDVEAQPGHVHAARSEAAARAAAERRARLSSQMMDIALQKIIGNGPTNEPDGGTN